MELQQLKYFKMVAEVGKISDAAQALFISAPALSTSISRLEKELGMPLFERTNNRIRLNRQGQILLRYANKIFGEVDCAKRELQQSILRQGQHVSLACVASTQWVDMVTAFSETHPGFYLQSTSIRRQELSAGGLSNQHSFLLCADEDVPFSIAEELDSMFLFEDHPVLMVHPEHPLAKKDTVDLSEILEENVFLPMQDFALYDHLLRLFENCGIPIPAGNAYSHLTTQHMVAKGMGVAFATTHMAKTPGLTIAYVPIRNDYNPWVCRLYWRKSRSFTPDEIIFKDFVSQFYGQH